jgi:hypothetical protein
MVKPRANAKLLPSTPRNENSLAGRKAKSSMALPLIKNVP